MWDCRFIHSNKCIHYTIASTAVKCSERKHHAHTEHQSAQVLHGPEYLFRVGLGYDDRKVWITSCEKRAFSKRLRTHAILSQGALGNGLSK